MNLSDIDIAILCGGQGSRIRDHLPPGLPKCLADINGTPFLEIVLHRLCDIGFFRFLLCLGYGAALIRKEFMLEYGDEHIIYRRGSDRQFRDYYLRVNQEGEPLGTGGAIVNALSMIQSDPFLAVNGDTVCDIDFKALLDNHLQAGFPITVPIDDQYRNVGVYVVTKTAMRIAASNLGAKFDLDDAVGDFARAGIPVNWYPTTAKYWDIGDEIGLSTFRNLMREKRP